MDKTRILQHFVSVSITAFLLALGYWQGLWVLDLFGREILESTSALAGFSLFLLISSVLFVNYLTRDTEEVEDSKDITAIIPTYRDSEVIENSVESLIDSDLENLEIDILTEPGDDHGRDKARELEKKYENIRSIVNKSGNNSKAGAINYAIENSDKEYFAVFDADQIVNEGFLSTASGYLEHYDVVQGRFIPKIEGLIENLSYYEYQLFGHGFRQLLFALTDFRMAASKTVLFSREAYSKVGGFSTDTISEDYDFAHKCYQNKLKVKMIRSKASKEVAVHSVKDWWGQRKRWMIGNIEVLSKNLKKLKSDDISTRLILSLVISLGSIGGSIFLISLLPKFFILIWNSNFLFVGLTLIGIYSIAIPPRIYDYKKNNVDSIGISWALTPLTLILFSIITINALIEYFINFDGSWYTVAK